MRPWCWLGLGRLVAELVVWPSQQSFFVHGVVMRRLATQSRGGSVKSQRDYQEVVDLGHPLCFKPTRKGEVFFDVRYELEEGLGKLAACGGYFAADSTATIQLQVLDPDGTEVASHRFVVEQQHYWTRLGFAWELNGGVPIHWDVRVSWEGPAQLTVWGLTVDGLQLPEPMQQKIADGWKDVLRPMHLPEAFYLSHDSPLCGGRILESAHVKWAESRRANPGKKCSQCQRLLPIDPRLAEYRADTPAKKRAPRSMVIAFHGHRSKKTGYQNECRSCKKFEINDHFNPIRTSDQHHESSTLTRERKLLLRESEVLELFKERQSKEGLRSFVWKRFRRRCFKCGVKVTVEGFQLDHTRPLAYLWPLDEHATCLCSDCNNTKKDSFPVDFYTPEELKSLAEIVGLPLAELQKRGVNQKELRRIRKDLVGFASTWSPRLFQSVASRVAELQPEIDLFEELGRVSPDLLRKIEEDLASRPAALLDALDGLDEDEGE